MSYSSPLARVHFPCSLLGQWTPLWWIFRKIETCWRGVFIKMFQDNWSILYKRDDSLGKCLVAATKFDAKFAARFAKNLLHNLLRIRTEVERYQLHLSIYWCGRTKRVLFLYQNIIYWTERNRQYSGRVFNIPDHYLLIRYTRSLFIEKRATDNILDESLIWEQQTIFWPSL